MTKDLDYEIGVIKLIVLSFHKGEDGGNLKRTGKFYRNRVEISEMSCLGLADAWENFIMGMGYNWECNFGMGKRMGWRQT